MTNMTNMPTATNTEQEPQKPQNHKYYKDYFDHEKLDVYQASISLIILIDAIVRKLPRGRSYLSDQLLRAGTSVPLNIAEGAGEFSANEKIRFYRMARRSATECSGIMDVCQQLNLIEENNYSKGRELLLRIVAMLTKMARITAPS